MVVGGKSGALAADFFQPPFSVIDARSGWWRQRKQRWLAGGMRSEQGRGRFFESMESAWGLNQKDGAAPAWATTSIFDPVLAELIYRWYAPAGGSVLDPFAGGVVRGLVASRLGLDYIGFEIRREQIEANERQWPRLRRDGDPAPKWIRQDACAKSTIRACPRRVDLVFTCPPYGDLEVYSGQHDDISALPWDTFAGALTHSIKLAAARLKDNRFAAYVVSDIRSPDGGYRGLPNVVRKAATAAGLKHHGDFVLLQSLGTAPIRARAQFTASRKAVRVHQNVLVFVKGSDKAARKALGTVNTQEPFLNAEPPVNE